MSTHLKSEKRISNRKSFESELDVKINSSAMEGTSVDISEGGIRFDTKDPLEIDIRFNVENRKAQHVGRLVWAKKKSEGGFTYAFEFIDLKNKK